LLNGQLAQATLRSEGEDLRPNLEVPLRERTLVLPLFTFENGNSVSSPFGEWQSITVLCACGALVHLDKGVVHRRRMLGKPVECHRCRNRRVAMEKEDLDNEFFGSEEE